MHNKKIPVALIDISNTPTNCLFDAWRQAASPVLDIRAIHDSHRYSVKITSYLVDNLVVNRVKYDATIFSRSRHLLTNGDTDYFVLQLFHSGSENIITERCHYRIAPGHIVLRDWRFGFIGIGEPSAQIGIAIPRQLLYTHDKINAQQPYLSWALNSVEGKMLANSIRQLCALLPRAAQEEAPVIASGFIGFLNGLLVNTLMPQSEHLRMNATMLLNIKDYIVTQLQNPALDVELLCHRFNLSRASLYRLFHDDGGLNNYIRGQRLVHCYHMLNENTNPNLKVRDIAEKFHYYSASLFNRVFKGQFGIAPSELLQKQFPVTNLPICKKNKTNGENAPELIKSWMAGQHVFL